MPTGRRIGAWVLDIDSSEDHDDGVAAWDKIAAEHDPVKRASIAPRPVARIYISIGARASAAARAIFLPECRSRAKAATS